MGVFGDIFLGKGCCESFESVENMLNFPWSWCNRNESDKLIS